MRYSGAGPACSGRHSQEQKGGPDMDANKLPGDLSSIAHTGRLMATGWSLISMAPFLWAPPLWILGLMFRPPMGGPVAVRKEAPAVALPKAAEAPKAEPPKPVAKVEAVKVEAPTVEEPKAEAPVAAEVKAETPVVVEVRAEAPVVAPAAKKPRKPKAKAPEAA